MVQQSNTKRLNEKKKKYLQNEKQHKWLLCAIDTLMSYTNYKWQRINAKRRNKTKIIYIINIEKNYSIRALTAVHINIFLFSFQISLLSHSDTIFLFKKLNFSLFTIYSNQLRLEFLLWQLSTKIWAHNTYLH